VVSLIASALFVFSLRIVDITFYTLRIVMVMLGRKRLAWVFGFVQALVYVGAIWTVLSNLDNELKMLGYATGYATGLVVGMIVEDRLAIGYTHLRIVSQSRGIETADGLRQAGFGATEVAAHGINGAVSIIHCSVLRKNLQAVLALIDQFDPDAFITAENVRQIQRGFWQT
jgi:uncharacterized protein YebE (UPF0316 family)